MPTQVFLLSALYMLRMIGLFMLLPVLALYASHFPGHTTFMVGLAIGIYGLTQALLQIPFGVLADKLGRKPMVIVGFTLFALGSVYAACSQSLVGLIVGRALQGAGVVSPAILAWVADITPFKTRSRAMAVIGIGIGMSFLLAIVLGPALQPIMGVDGIFLLITGASMAAIILTLFLPSPAKLVPDTGAIPSRLKAIIQNNQILRLSLGIGVLHALMTANFVIIPPLFRDVFAISTGYHSIIYLTIFIISVLFMLPFIIYAEKKQQMRQVVIISIIILLASELLMSAFHGRVWGLVIALGIFFIAFNVLEACLPSWISKVAETSSKGTAMGFYGTCQFLGAFIGASLAGAVLHFGVAAVFLLNAALATLWLFLAFGLHCPFSRNNG